MLKFRLQRQLMIVTRNRALMAAMAGALMLFVLVSLFVLKGALDDGGEITIRTAVGITLATLGTLAAGLTPWAVLEMTRSDDRARLVRWIAASGARPWKETAVQVIVSWGFLLQLLLLSLPVLVILPSLGAVSTASLGKLVVGLAAFLLLVVLVTCHLNLDAKSYLGALVLSYSSLTMLVVARCVLQAAAGPTVTLAVVLALSLVSGLLLLMRSNRRLLYLEV